MSSQLIHYDCDPGQDDAIALLFAFGAGVNISGISVVGGNVDVQKCARNALQLLELTGRLDVPVFVGATHPLKRESKTLPDVFGECGMAGANLPEPQKELETLSACDYLGSQELPETLVLTGPLTNLALALQQNPKIKENVRRLIIMGGCVFPEKIHGRLGNIQVKGSQGWAEYNFAVDPEAAKIVFSAGFDEICLIPLEVTRSVLYGNALDKKLRNLNSTVATVAANILATVGDEDKEDYLSVVDFPEDPVRAMHDVIAMAYLTNPEIFKTEKLPLRIEIGSFPTVAGQTIIDKVNPDSRKVTVIRDLNCDIFLEKMLAYLANL